MRLNYQGYPFHKKYDFFHGFFCSFQDDKNVMKMKTSLIFLLSLSLTPTWAHVGLTFPPARQYDLDFLDSVRTKPPCGMPKGKFLKNLFLSHRNYVECLETKHYC